MATALGPALFAGTPDLDPALLAGPTDAEKERWSRLQHCAVTLPATALNFSFCQFISVRLDGDDNLRCQDWRGFAEKVGLTFQEIQRLKNRENKVLEILDEFQKHQESSVGALIIYIEELQRFDILQDPEFWNLLDQNLASYKRANERRIKKAVDPIQDDRVSSTSELTQFPQTPTHRHREPTVHTSTLYPGGGLAAGTDHHFNEFEIITTGDVAHGRSITYDAFVAYTYPDLKFVKRMLQELEIDQFKLSLCVHARDLLPGTAFYTVTAKLIEERCKRIIIVLSPEFMHDPMCDFFVKFAHSLSPGSRSKKLIPVLTNHCYIPQILRYITLVDHTKSDLQEWFWERLARSLQAPLIFQDDERFTSDDLNDIQITLSDPPSRNTRYAMISTMPSSPSSQPIHSSSSSSQPAMLINTTQSSRSSADSGVHCSSSDQSQSNAMLYSRDQSQSSNNCYSATQPKTVTVEVHTPLACTTPPRSRQLRAGMLPPPPRFDSPQADRRGQIKRVDSDKSIASQASDAAMPDDALLPDKIVRSQNPKKKKVPTATLR